jgi:hypothetical protein
MLIACTEALTYVPVRPPGGGAAGHQRLSFRVSPGAAGDGLDALFALAQVANGRGANSSPFHP